MDKRLIEALTYGPEWLLTKFVNLPAIKDGPTAPAEEFRNAYGDLWGADYPPSDYYDLVRSFQLHWRAKTAVEKQQLISFVAKLFSNAIKPADLGPNKKGGSLPLLKVNSLAGTVELPIETVMGMLTSHGAIRFEPRTLLHYLATWLLTFRRQRKLGFCERKDCTHPYYVKTHPRYRYCSPDCSAEAGRSRKNRWWRNNRGVGAKRTTKRTA